MTIGYKHVTAIEGSITSNSRIIFAGLLGAAFFGDKITLQLIIGTILIIFAVITIRKNKSQSVKK